MIIILFLKKVLRSPNTNGKHWIKSVRILSYSGLHFPAFGLNTKRHGDLSVFSADAENADQSNSEYGHFSRSENRI